MPYLAYEFHHLRCHDRTLFYASYGTHELLLWTLCYMVDGRDTGSNLDGLYAHPLATATPEYILARTGN